jgi:hypothetical protein
MRAVHISYPGAAAIQTGTVALVAPTVADSVLEWAAIIGFSLMGWMALFIVLYLMAKGD